MAVQFTRFHCPCATTNLNEEATLILSRDPISSIGIMDSLASIVPLIISYLFSVAFTTLLFVPLHCTVKSPRYPLYFEKLCHGSRLPVGMAFSFHKVYRT